MTDLDVESFFDAMIVSFNQYEVGENAREYVFQNGAGRIRVTAKLVDGERKFEFEVGGTNGNKLMFNAFASLVDAAGKCIRLLSVEYDAWVEDYLRSPDWPPELREEMFV